MSLPPLAAAMIELMAISDTKIQEPLPDPRDPDHTRPGIFATHNCWRCKDGDDPCVQGNPRTCEFPRARND